MSIPEIPTPGRRSKILGVVAVVVALLFFLVPVIVSNYTELQWFRSIDYQAIFLGVLATRVVLFIIFGLLAGLIVWGACFAAYRSAKPTGEDDLADITDLSDLGMESGGSPLSQNREEIRKALRPFLIIVPLVAALAAGMIAQGNWRIVRMFFSGGDFGVTDPQFQKDLGFYAFTLPMLQFVLSTLSILLIVAFLVNLLGHYLLGTISTGNPRIGEKAGIGAPARKQLAIIAGVWMLLKAADYWFQRPAEQAARDLHRWFLHRHQRPAAAKILLLTVAIPRRDVLQLHRPEGSEGSGPGRRPDGGRQPGVGAAGRPSWSSSP